MIAEVNGIDDPSADPAGLTSCTCRHRRNCPSSLEHGDDDRRSRAFDTPAVTLPLVRRPASMEECCPHDDVDLGEAAPTLSISVFGLPMMESPNRLVRTVVDATVQRPDMFELTFLDREGIVCRPTASTIGIEITISLGSGPHATDLIVGEVTVDRGRLRRAHPLHDRAWVRTRPPAPAGAAAAAPSSTRPTATSPARSPGCRPQDRRHPGPGRDPQVRRPGRPDRLGVPQGSRGRRSATRPVSSAASSSSGPHRA